MALHVDTIDTGDEPRRGRTAAMIAIPVAIGAGALGGAVFLLPDDDPEALQSGDSAAPADTTVPATDPATTEVFTQSESTVITAATTTLAPTTSAAPTTTAAPASTVPTDTLVATPDTPIAPPADPRGPEDQIQLGALSIPTLGVEAPLLEGIRLTTLDNGPGHWPGTALPGEPGNVVVAAHRTSHGGPFRNIDQLTAGDSVVFTTASGETEYVVTETMIVQPDALWIVDQTDDATATLFACHPPGSVAQRIVVKLALAT
ncbi:MAG: class E sortase [Actinomycetota bacterium]